MDRAFAHTRRVSPFFAWVSASIAALCLAAPAATAPLARPQGSAAGLGTLRLGEHGRAVRELQLELAWRGFPSGAIDARFGQQLAGAVRRFQRAVHLRADGVAGPATIALLRGAPRWTVIPLGWPLLAPVGDPFGPRGDRFHAGIDLPAPTGTPVLAAAAGRVTWAGLRDGGWGELVTIAHVDGVRTMYAHLSTIDVHIGEWIAGGTVIGRVGSTGDATGPHLHFEVRADGAAIDPLRALVNIPAAVRALAAGR
jgi:murein DD-endopeptidase MepM/ murein hydrolase activator NlpD